MTRPRTRFLDVLITQTIRELERSGPLDDAQALRTAAGAGGGQERQLIERAWVLADRIGLGADLQRLRAALPVLALVAAVGVGALSYALLFAVIGEGRTINAISAFAAVLGLHLLSLLAWLLALLAPGASGLGGWAGAGFARVALWLGAHWPALGGRNGPTLLRAAADLLARARLLPWGFGLVSHGIWALAFALLLPLLFWVFAFKSYRLNWETTILPAQFFVDFVRVSGWLPGALGLPTMDGAALGAPGGADADHRLWAWWLIGSTLVYGLLPRLVLALLCWGVWRVRQRALGLDTADPYFRKLLNRLAALRPSAVVDAEQRAAVDTRRGGVPGRPEASGAPLLVGFELPADVGWPPAGLALAGAEPPRILGSSAERRELLALIADSQPRRLLVACDGATSPDRGTERFLREAAAEAGATAVLLVRSGARAIDAQRWVTWLREHGLDGLAVFTEASDAAAWGAPAHG